MNRLSPSLLRRIGLGIALLWFGLGCSSDTWSQDRSRYDRTTAINQANSRAESEAEQLVSLSADKIISMLQQETGLLLQVKKSLVRKAFEQGRLLDPEDLTDDALFHLIREDQGIRVLATREIEDRYYIRAKPTLQELERKPPCQPSMQTGSGSSQKEQVQPGEVRRTPSQEEVYWAKHELDSDCFPLQYPSQYPPSGTLSSSYGQPSYTQPSGTQPQYPSQQYPQQQYPQQQYPPSQSAPQNLPTDLRRELERTQMQSPSGDSFDGMQGDVSQMAPIQPDELPGLLTASMTGRSSSLSGPGRTTGGMDTIGSLGSYLGSGGSLQNQSGFPQQTRLDNRSRSQLPPFFVPTPSANPALRHRPNPYADVPSLFDLYSQYSKRSPVLQRFGEDVFRNGTGNSEQLPMDLPAGPDYVVGPGDGLSIELWGGISQRLQRVVDREGRVALPEVGAIEVSGRNLGDVQHLVQTVLRNQFRNIEADVSLSRLRTVRVYVVGDVERPGAYDISSLSTPLNAVYTAGGPTSRGSLRILRHYRGKQLIQEVDVYDLLLHGIRSDVARLEAGDTVLVPPLGPEITIEGMVRRPAIYELDGEKSLAEALELAGGVLPSGTLRHVDLERLAAHESRTMLRLDIPESNNQENVTKVLEDFKVQDGDKVKISAILPYADKTVYLDGHVFSPGKFAYRDGMKVTDLIKSYNDLLPEPYKAHAEIIRLNPPDYTPTVLAFNLGDALAGKDQDLVLKPFDTVRVFGRFDFEDAPVVTVSGEVRDPGDHITNGATYFRDAVYLAGGTTPDALLDDAQVFRRTDDGKLKVISVNVAKALEGDEKENVLLGPKDRVFIHRNLAKLDPPTVIIQGEVARPGKYPLGDNMTAAQLVRLSGGLKRGAYTQTADLTRYLVEDDKKVMGEHMTVPIAAALSGQADTDMQLRDGDVLTVGELAGWNDIGATIAVKGEVLHPGGYGIREGERLSSILERAGGFRANAYPYGAVLERVQVRQLEERNRADLIREVQDEGTALKSVQSTDADDKMVKEASLLQWKTTLDRLQNTPPEGRLVIHISSNIKRWANTPADIQVRAGDTIYIPKRPNVVMVDGSVYNPTAVSYRPGKSAGWYLRQAGGPTNMANKKAIFVIRADGSVAGGSGGLFTGSAEGATLQPGDMVVVPQRAFSGTSKWKNTLQVAQLAQSVAFAIQLGRSF